MLTHCKNHHHYQHCHHIPLRHHCILLNSSGNAKNSQKEIIWDVGVCMMKSYIELQRQDSNELHKHKHCSMNSKYMYRKQIYRLAKIQCSIFKNKLSKHS